MLCGSCNTSQNVGTNCGYCKKHYCFSCSKLSEDEYGAMKPLRAAWKCPSCRLQMDAPPPYQSVASEPTGTSLNGINSVEIIRKLNDISSKLDCLPKLVEDVAKLRSELVELRRTCGLLAKPSAPELSDFNEPATKVCTNKARAQHTAHNSAAQASSSGHKPVKPTAHNPFAFAPASMFDLEEFKRYFSNNKPDASILYFWEKFDPEHYSVWHCTYKYPQELTKVFMSCNLITGMFQRLEKLRKHAFACVCVFGQDSDCSIAGVWVWRGHELVFTLSPDWQDDYEHYEWRKLELVSKDTMRLVRDYLSRRAADTRGRPLTQAKIFK